MSEFTFDKNIKSVALIGSGPAGTPAARHLRDAGLNVRVFERQGRPGGIWNWRPEITKPIQVPTPPPSRGAFTPIEITGESEKVYKDAGRVQREAFCPANPVYASLSNNVPTTTMAFKDYPYPAGTKPNILHHDIARYVHSYAKEFNIGELTTYNTRVEKVEKIGPRWRLSLRNVETIDEERDLVRERTTIEEFDAVVVATGHYTAPFIPAINGVKAWADTWPTKVIHSQGYRKPELYADQNVLIVGTGTSGVDIAWDLQHHARSVILIGKDEIEGPEQYQKMRKMQRHLLPRNGVQLGEIRAFKPPSGGGIEDAVIELRSGKQLTGVSSIIFATGYQYSFPFLEKYHHDPLKPASIETLVTTGEGVHNLYRDVFYISDPTLAFLGLSINTSAFSFFEYQGISVARVFAGTARLPSQDAMRSEYSAILKQRGGGRFVHLLGKELERKYVRDTVEWINRDADCLGGTAITGHSEEWLKSSDTISQSIVAKYGIDPREIFSKEGDVKPVERADQQLYTNGSSATNNTHFKLAVRGHVGRWSATRA